jgi:hypothetical protein
MPLHTFTQDANACVVVYMRDEDDGSLINIAEYDQEYDKEDPV